MPPEGSDYEGADAKVVSEREGATLVDDDSVKDDIATVRRRVVKGAAVVASRDVSVKVVALAGNIAFARLLSPSEFGTVAFGLTLLMLGQLLSEGGLGVGLIRGQREPRLEDLRVLLGFQLILTTVLAGVTALVGVQFGRAG